FFFHQVDHTTQLHKLIGLAYGQHRQRLDFVQDFAQALPLRIADEENLAFPEVAAFFDRLNEDLPPGYPLAFDHLFERITESVLPTQADDDWRIGPGKDSRRPV